MRQTEEIIRDISALAQAETSAVTTDTFAALDGDVANAQEFREILPAIGAEYAAAKENASKCEANEKQWKSSKAVWKTRAEALTAFIGRQLERFNLKSADNGGVKASSRITTNLETDDAALLAQWEPDADVLRSRVPSYVKVTLSIDKTELKKTVEADQSLLLDYPEAVYWKDKKSFTIKA